MAFKWYDVTVEKSGNTITWAINGNLITSSSLTGVSLSGANIFFRIFDSNAASSADANDFLNTAIFDNIVVTVPEPSTLSLAMLGGLGVWLLGRRRK